MGIGMSGMVSGLDTDSIVQAMVSSYVNKKDDLTKAQTKLQWKMDAWKELNTKVYNFYSKNVSNLRFSSNYIKKTTSISDTTVAKITASNSSVNGTQSLAVVNLAKAGYLTGGKVSNQTDSSQKLTSSSKLGDLGISDSSSIVVGSAGNETTITVDGSTTISSLVTQLKNAGLNANFDETNQRFFISAKESGASNDFTLTAGNSAGKTALSKLGLSTSSVSESELANYKKWADYTDEDIEKVVDEEIKNQYNNKKTTTDTQKANLQSQVTSLESKNVTLYQAQYLYALKDMNSSDDIKSYITKEKEDLEKQLEDENNVLTSDDKAAVKNKLSALTALESSLKDEEGNYDTAKVSERLKNVADSLSLNADDNSFKDSVDNNLNQNLTEISGYNAIINDETKLQEYTNKENAEIEEEIKNTVPGQIEARQQEAKDFVAAYEKQQTNLADIANGTASDKVKNAQNLQAQYLAEFAKGDYTHQTDYDDSVKEFGNLAEDTSGNGATRIIGEDAVIYLNGAKFESSENTFNVNGLSITATETTGLNDDGSYKTVSITTSDDTDAIYDMIRDFISEYNTLINEMDKLYNADSSKGYEPLTDDEKEEMTESEIEKWETKIKDSLLKNDSTLNTVAQAMKSVMQQGFTVNGKTMYLSDFGIGTQSYFSAADNEKSALHIDGDEDDSVTSGNEDKLKAMIANDPDTVVSFFSALSNSLYTELGNKMTGTTLSSSYTLYNDKQMQSEYSQYTTKISEQQTKITWWENYYYDQFTAMETALSKLNSQQSALSGLFSS